MTQLFKPSRVIGPEDIRVGDFITVTHTTYEFLCCFFAFDSDPNAKVKTKRVTFMADDAGQPMEVIEACLPFVLVKNMHGECCTLDLRRHQVARLTSSYGRKAFKAAKKRHNQ